LRSIGNGNCCRKEGKSQGKIGVLGSETVIITDCCVVTKTYSANGDNKGVISECTRVKLDIIGVISECTRVKLDIIGVISECTGVKLDIIGAISECTRVKLDIKGAMSEC